ncbi:ornithine--oxo-acid transaminase, partial [Streptomyces sp. SID10244]|nr:ornithine--oxo-acid transaminase [Streptomyces sp. SID10244]
PDAIVATDDDAAALGLNLVSDGRHVVMTDAAPHLTELLRAAGYDTIAIDLSELLKGGGGIKCCTLELRGIDKEVLVSPPAVSGPAVSPPAGHLSAEPHVAHNYSPLPVTAATAQGAWITDIDGRRFLDCLGA